MLSRRQRLFRFLERAPLPVQIFIKLADYLLLLILCYAGYKLFRRFSHRLPMRSWDNY